MIEEREITAHSTIVADHQLDFVCTCDGRDYLTGVKFLSPCTITSAVLTRLNGQQSTEYNIFYRS